jgi:hypothetical protein
MFFRAWRHDEIVPNKRPKSGVPAMSSRQPKPVDNLPDPTTAGSSSRSTP